MSTRFSHKAGRSGQIGTADLLALPIRLGLAGRMCLTLGRAGRHLFHVDPPSDLVAAGHDDAYFEHEIQLGRRFVRLFDTPLSVRGSDVLEIGCGFGGMLHVFGEQGAASVTGIDIDESRAAYARKKMADRASVVTAPAERLPFPDQSFDLVACDSTIEHVNDIGLVLAEVRRVLRPGGRFFGAWGNSWWSANGPHHMKVLPVPWIQLVVSDRTLIDVIRHLAAKGAMPDSYLEYKLLDLNRMGKTSRRMFARAARAAGFDVLEHANRSSHWWKHALAQLPVLTELLAGDLAEVLRRPG